MLPGKLKTKAGANDDADDVADVDGDADADVDGVVVVVIGVFGVVDADGQVSQPLLPFSFH